MPDRIEMIDANTRRRNGKLEKKDPITGCWCIHPAQFFADNRHEMEDMFKEIEEDDERERQEMFDIKKAQDFVNKEVSEYDEDAKDVIVEKVIHVKLKGGFSREQSMEIIFDGKLKGQRGRFLAGCWSFSGDRIDPPDSDCWFDDVKAAIERLEKTVKEHTTPDKKRGWADPEKQRKGLTGPDCFSPIANKEQYDHEKLRLENISRNDIDRLAYLKKHQPTWKYE
jgi:hypothetical protein